MNTLDASPQETANEITNAVVIEGSNLLDDEVDASRSWAGSAVENTGFSYYQQSSNYNSHPQSIPSSYHSMYNLPSSIPNSQASSYSSQINVLMEPTSYGSQYHQSVPIPHQLTQNSTNILGSVQSPMQIHPRSIPGSIPLPNSSQLSPKIKSFISPSHLERSRINSQQPQRSLLSSMIQQSNRNNSTTSLRREQYPAEPVLEARGSVDQRWFYETLSSPPRDINLENYSFSPRILPTLPRPSHLKVFHFANCDANLVIKMISKVLSNVINDEVDESFDLMKPVNMDGERFKLSLIQFHGSNVPGISIEAYFNRILKYCPMTPDIFLSLLVYFDRIRARGKELSITTKSLFSLNSFNVHRLIIAGMTVASKFFSDIFYKNARYAKVGGLPVDELNGLELQFLLLLDLRLMVSLEDLQKYADFVLNYSEHYERSE